MSGVPVSAQMGDMSPNLLIESLPSDRPDYRRMILVHYLNGPNVTVSYAAYNRTEFKQVQMRPSSAQIGACINGASTSLNQIDAFERAAAQRQASGAAVQVERFCIKGVSNWESGNRKRYLDPIFNGLPYAASMKNGAN
jgi:hypothetical protein